VPQGILKRNGAPVPVSESAILTAVASGRTSGLSAHGTDRTVALTEGLQSALLISAGFVVVAIALVSVVAGGIAAERVGADAREPVVGAA
jgi:phage-related minor tail protein